MALLHIVLLLLGCTAVTEVRGQCNGAQLVLDCQASIDSQQASGTLCTFGDTTDALQNCLGQCSDALSDTEEQLLVNHITRLWSACFVGNAVEQRACDLTDAGTCAFSISTFILQSGQLASVDINNAVQVCGFVNQYASGANACVNFISGCLEWVIPAGQATISQVSSITSYVLTTTGQSCVCIADTNAVVGRLTAIPAGNGAGTTACTTAQADLSRLMTATRVCTEALPANPISSLPVFNVDFRATAISLVNIGAGTQVAQCGLQFVEAKAGLSSSLSIALLVATLLMHVLRQS